MGHLPSALGETAAPFNISQNLIIHFMSLRITKKKKFRKMKYYSLFAYKTFIISFLEMWGGPAGSSEEIGLGEASSISGWDYLHQNLYESIPYPQLRVLVYL